MSLSKSLVAWQGPGPMGAHQIFLQLRLVGLLLIFGDMIWNIKYGVCKKSWIWIMEYGMFCSIGCIVLKSWIMPREGGCETAFIRICEYCQLLSYFLLLAWLLAFCSPAVSFSPFVCLSVLSVCLFVCLSVCLFVCLSVCLFVCLSVCLFVVCLFVRLFVCSFVRSFACLLVCLFVCFCFFCLFSYQWGT